VIARLYRDEQRYVQLARTSRAAFESRLNWDAWGVAVKHILAELPAVTSSTLHNSLLSLNQAQILLNDAEAI
jgi:hypothetical protein